MLKRVVIIALLFAVGLAAGHFFTNSASAAGPYNYYGCAYYCEPECQGGPYECYPSLYYCCQYVYCGYEPPRYYSCYTLF